MTGQPRLAGVSFAADLARFGDRPAVLAGSRAITYRELARRVDGVVRELGTVRRLVALEAANDLPSLVAYLAALAGGHPLLVLPAGKPAALEALLAAYDPDVVVRSAVHCAGAEGHDGGTLPGASPAEAPRLEERRQGTRHRLHPELALLLSTSGSTGSPKLVRLGRAGVEANAAAIAEYLHLRPEDRAATTLPFSYCYGLSVVNSHLTVGAALVLTDLSVVDECFWGLVREQRVTSFAAVPYTFELLERVGFADMDLPHLRYITQAGGRLDPERVRHYATLGHRRGWDLFVMYGATEATARMAYLPPDLAAEHPTAIGVPIPGGSFRLEAVEGLEGPDGEPARELVYAGPNVMLGYADRPEDLALGRAVHELRTGDLARRTGPGLFEIVGRRSRFVKIVGLRVDLGQVERLLADDGVVSAAAGRDGAGDDARLVVAVETGDGGAGDAAAVETGEVGEAHDAGLLAKDLAVRLGLPRSAVAIAAVESIPRLPNGKTDYQAVLALGDAAPAPRASGGAASAEEPLAVPGSSADVARIFADALEVERVRGEDTFVSLGGDSLSYVAASVRLEEALGTLPANWHLMPVAELAAMPDAVPPPPGPQGGPGRRDAWRRRASPRRARGFAAHLADLAAPLETGIVLRAVAIVFIIATHIELFVWPGTAHVLFALAGFNFARFQLAGPRAERVRGQLRSLTRIVVPSVALIGFAFLATGQYSWHNLVLLNAVLGPEGWNTTSRFWFVEELVYVLVGVTALLAVPWADRAQRRFPWAFPLGLFGVALLERYEIVPSLAHQGPVLWLFALGWAMAASRTLLQRSFVTFLALVTLPGFFQNEYRIATILAGILLLAWLPRLPLPRALHRLTAVLAGASLYVYLTHWLVYPLVLEGGAALGLDAGPGGALTGLAVVLSLAAGVAYWAAATRAMAAVERRWGSRRRVRAAV